MVTSWECCAAEGEAEHHDTKADEEVQISGRIIQLNIPTSVKLTVKTHFNDHTSTSSWGRTLTVGSPDGDDFVLTATPGILDAPKIESFIDAVLDAIAHRGTDSS